MTIAESFWFASAIAIIFIVLVIDPKNSVQSTTAGAISGFFSSPSSGQNFIYKFSAFLILLFYLLTVYLSLV